MLFVEGWKEEMIEGVKGGEKGKQKKELWNKRGFKLNK